MSYMLTVKLAASNAIQLVADERARQRRKFDYDHDDDHSKGELITAANLIAMDVQCRDSDCIDETDDEFDTWQEELAVKVRLKYGKNYKRRLVIAAAMLLAEIERIERTDLVNAEEGKA